MRDGRLRSLRIYIDPNLGELARPIGLQYVDEDVAVLVATDDERTPWNKKLTVVV